jgi:HSP20 family protein
LDRLRREMDRMFADWPTSAEWPTSAGWGAATAYPAMNVWTNEDGAVVTAELPGVDPEDIDISVVNDTLTLTGTRQPKEVEGATYHRRERGQGRFTRSFQLPFRIEGEEVEASFERGVLHIHLPRAQEDKPKKITVKAG